MGQLLGSLAGNTWASVASTVVAFGKLLNTKQSILQ